MTGEQKKQKKEMLVELMSNDLYVPMKIKELAILLQVPKERRQELQEVLDELMLEGKIEVSAKGKYSLGKGKLLTGGFTAHARGFGFVTVEENSLHTVDFKPSFSISFWVEFNHLHAV